MKRVAIRQNKKSDLDVVSELAMLANPSLWATYMEATPY